MSIACAILVEEGCWVGTDTQMTLMQSIAKRQDAKAAEHGGITALVVGSLLAERAVREVLGGRPATIEQLLDLLRGHFQELEWPGKTEDDGPAVRDVAYLVTDGRSLYQIDGALGAMRVGIGEFTAIGSGAGLAQGAAHAAMALGASPATTMCLAIEAACRHNVYCGGEAKVWFVPRSETILGEAR